MCWITSEIFENCKWVDGVGVEMAELGLNGVVTLSFLNGVVCGIF